MANTSHASDCGSLRLRVVGVDWGCGGQASRDIYGRCAGSRGNGHGFRIIYTAIAVWARAKSTREFYIAGGEVNPVMNGMATAADWLSAASFISVAGLISVGYVNSSFIMGWTGGYVLLATLLAPYMRRFGAYTVPDFVGKRHGTKTARVVAVGCLLIISLTYVIGQMTGAGVASAAPPGTGAEAALPGDAVGAVGGVADG